jgi:hypothetical protein
MNKQRFRLVFNKVRSVLMAVAEITVSCVGKAAGETRGLLGSFGCGQGCGDFWCWRFCGVSACDGLRLGGFGLGCGVWWCCASPASPNPISANFFGKGFAD